MGLKGELGRLRHAVAKQCATQGGTQGFIMSEELRLQALEGLYAYVRARQEARSAAEPASVELPGESEDVPLLFPPEGLSGLS
jgi:hypothetical protein